MVGSKQGRHAGLLATMHTLPALSPDLVCAVSTAQAICTPEQTPECEREWGAQVRVLHSVVCVVVLCVHAKVNTTQLVGSHHTG
jgi:hypothetical protein